MLYNRSGRIGRISMRARAATHIVDRDTSTRVHDKRFVQFTVFEDSAATWTLLSVLNLEDAILTDANVENSDHLFLGGINNGIQNLANCVHCGVEGSFI